MKAELTSIQDAYDDLQVRAREQANREEELRHRAKDATASRDSEHAARVKAEREMRDLGDQLLDAQDEIKALRRELDEIERSLTREVEDKDRVRRIIISLSSASTQLIDFILQSLKEAQSSLKSSQALLEQRETDLAAVQAALQAIESEKRKLGESATTDKFSLELEVDRLRRDLQRCEDDLQRAREDVKDRERVRREREGALDKLVRVEAWYRGLAF